MAEGPSIVILRDRAAALIGETVVHVEGNTPAPKERLLNQRVSGVRSFGKLFFVEFEAGPTLRVHLTMLGSYCFDQRKDKPVRLRLAFGNGRELNLYSCSTRIVDEPVDTLVDARIDVMADAWDAALARKHLRAEPDALVCDALLDQAIFAGVGNVIKNEILFRIRLHPLSTVGALPAKKLGELVRQARDYTFEFYAWKKADMDRDHSVWRGDTLASHWRVHNKKTCPRCEIPLQKEHLGELDRRSFWCERCQKRHG